MSKRFLTSAQSSDVLFIVFMLLVVLSVNRVFNYIVIQQYKTLIDQKGLIETFHIGNVTAIQQFQKQYHLEYEVVRRENILKKTNPALPDINPIIIQTKPEPDVISNSIRNNLKQIRPKITINSLGLFIVFPLVFQDKTDQYIVFNRLFP